MTQRHRKCSTPASALNLETDHADTQGMERRALGRARRAAVVAGLALIVAPVAARGQSLSVTPISAGDFAPVTLDGSSKVRNAAVSGFSVTDSRLVSAGWNVTVASTTFQRWDGFAYVPGNPFPAGSLMMGQVAVTPADPLGVPPTITPGPYLIDGNSVKIASALAVTGSGTFNFSQSGPLALAVPASAYEGTYRAELTVTVTSGP